MMTALRQVAREGNLTIAAVSSAAGITRATFYNHFESLEQAAWFAVSERFVENMAQDTAARKKGDDPDDVGIESLRRNVELLRVDHELVRLADNYQAYSVLPGLADIILSLITEFRTEFGSPAAANSAAEDIYIAAGLYAVMATGARGEQDPRDVASVAYSLLPAWMRNPRQTI